MKKPSQVGEEDLATIAGHVQDWLYLDTSLPIDSPSRYRRHQVDAEAFVSAMNDLLTELGMDPPDAPEDLAKAKRTEEFAAFVGDLLKDPASPHKDVGGGLSDAAGPRVSLPDDDALLGSMADAQAGQPVTTTFLPPSPMVAEDIRRGDLVVVIDGKFRLHNRDEAVKRLIAEFETWSGGNKPEEVSFEEREDFLEGRDLDAAQSLAMWPDRLERQVEA